MSTAMPYVKWHGRDWLGDPMLRMVGPEVRGVWIDLLCAMMNADPYGHLAVNGKPMTDDQAARMTGLDKGTFKGILDQIEQANISSRTPCGMLYSRRLVRDHEAFLRASKAGKKGGGNPNIRSHSPETIVQKPEAKDPLKIPLKVKPPDGGVVVLPFTSPAFTEAWRNWKEHRRRIRKPMTDHAQELALGKLPKDEATAIRWIDHAIEKGWQGIYDPQAGARKTAQADSGLVNTWHDPNPDITMRNAF